MLDRFAESLSVSESDILDAVREYANWRTHDHAETWLPSANDDVAIRTFLLHLRTGDADRATLLAAKARPEEHRDLVVRVAGYSDYFVGLPEGTQDELIARTEHAGG